MTNPGAWFWMKLLHLQQIPVVAHTTHNRPIQPDQTQTQPLHTPSYSHFHPDIPSIPYHLHTPTHTQTLTRLIVNKLLTLYISIDILTFMWYNQNNGEGPFVC